MAPEAESRDEPGMLKAVQDFLTGENLGGDRIHAEKSGEKGRNPIVSEPGPKPENRYYPSELQEQEPSDLDVMTTVFFYDPDGEVEDNRDSSSTFQDQDFRPRVELKFYYNDEGEYIGFTGDMNVSLSAKGVPESFKSPDTENLSYGRADSEDLWFMAVTDSYEDLDESLGAVIELADRLSKAYIEEEPSEVRLE